MAFLQVLSGLTVLVFLSNLLQGSVGDALRQGLGFPPLVILWLVWILSHLNIPLHFHERTIHFSAELDPQLRAEMILLQGSRTTMIAVNVGGGLLPIGLALYQFWRVSPLVLAVVILAAVLISYKQSVSAAGSGILLVQPIAVPAIATLLSLVLAHDQAASVAFAGAVLGVFIGADLLRIREFLSVNSETISSGKVVSIGAAGLFDAIAMTGILAIGLSHLLIQMFSR